MEITHIAGTYARGNVKVVLRSTYYTYTIWATHGYMLLKVTAAKRLCVQVDVDFDRISHILNNKSIDAKSTSSE